MNCYVHNGDILTDKIKKKKLNAISLYVLVVCASGVLLPCLAYKVYKKNALVHYKSYKKFEETKIIYINVLHIWWDSTLNAEKTTKVHPRLLGTALTYLLYIKVFRHNHILRWCNHYSMQAFYLHNQIPPTSYVGPIKHRTGVATAN